MKERISHSTACIQSVPLRGQFDIPSSHFLFKRNLSDPQSSSCQEPKRAKHCGECSSERAQLSARLFSFWKDSYSSQSLVNQTQTSNVRRKHKQVWMGLTGWCQQWTFQANLSNLSKPARPYLGISALWFLYNLPSFPAHLRIPGLTRNPTSREHVGWPHRAQA